MYCPRCGMQHNDDAQFCTACGLKFEEGQPTQERAEPIIPTAPAASTYSGKAIAGFVLSLVGLFCAGLIMGILGIVFSRKGMRECDENPSLSGHGLAIAGLVISILDVVAWAFAVLYILFVIVIVALTV